MVTVLRGIARAVITCRDFRSSSTAAISMMKTSVTTIWALLEGTLLTLMASIKTK